MNTNTKLQRITYLSSQDQTHRFFELMSLFNEQSLLECFYSLDGKKAVGTDQETKEEFGVRLYENISSLLQQMKSMSYRPCAVREVQIPKVGKPNATRPLGISNFKDKIVQRQIEKVLTSIYEPLFLKSSYGFRPGRGCHDALRALDSYLYGNPVSYILDVDLENYFGSIDHQTLMSLIAEKIKDKRFIRYLWRLLKAGVLRNGELSIDEYGVPQGSICSPILSNIFAHYVIDQWFEEVVKKYSYGSVELFRYCDDFVICCELKRDAQRIEKALKGRLEKYHLKLNEEKTQIVPFQRSSALARGSFTSFDFLGFSFYWGRSQKGRCIPKLKSSGKRMTYSLKKLCCWIKQVRNRYKLTDIWKSFCSKLRGYIGYYGVSFNTKKLETYVYLATRIIFKWLNQRSQKKSFRWEKFQLFMKRHPLPKIKIHHRFFVQVK